MLPVLPIVDPTHLRAMVMSCVHKNSRVILPLFNNNFYGFKQIHVLKIHKAQCAHSSEETVSLLVNWLDKDHLLLGVLILSVSTPKGLSLVQTTLLALVVLPVIQI